MGDIKCKRFDCDHYLCSEEYCSYSEPDCFYIPPRCDFYYPPRKIPTFYDVGVNERDDLYCIAVYKPTEEYDE